MDSYEINLLDSNIRNLCFIQVNLAHKLNNLCDSDYDLLKRDGTFRGLDAKTSNQYEFALKLLNSNLQLSLDSKNWFSHNFELYLMGESYYKMQQFDKALPFLHRALVMADTLGNLDKQRLALNKLSQVHESMGRYDSALYYYQKHILIRDSLNNNQKLKDIQRKEMQYQFDVKEKDLLHQKEVSDLNASFARQLAQEHLLRLKTSEQALSLRSKELELSNKGKEVSHQAYLKNKAELQALDFEKQGQEKQLALLNKENQLVRQLVRNRSLQRNISFGIILVSIVILGIILRSFLRQQKHNRQLREVNAEIEKINYLLQHSNEELSSTIDELRTTQEKLVETERQKEKEAIRRRIAQDMHDEISSGLTKIIWLCAMAGKKVAMADWGPVSGMIGRISESSRATVERIGEIIWAIDPDRDNLEGFYAYLRSYIMEYLEPTGYKVRLAFPARDGRIRFNPDVKRTLFTVIKEALHNVVKHAKGDEVAVNFSVKGGTYTVMIDDNGQGLSDDALNSHRSGLRNMRARMESVGGSFRIEKKNTPGMRIMLAGLVAGK